MFYKFTDGLGTGKSVRLCAFIHSGNKRRRDATAKQNAGTCCRPTLKAYSGRFDAPTPRLLGHFGRGLTTNLPL
jgi:hypothetical protein